MFLQLRFLIEIKLNAKNTSLISVAMNTYKHTTLVLEF